MSPKEDRNGKSLRYSIVDGVFASLMTGFTQDYFTPYLLVLGGTIKHVGISTALSQLASSVIQLRSADIADRLRSRKRLINIFVFLQAMMLLPMIFTYIMGGMRIAAFIAVAALFAAFGSFVLPAWGSLMADLVASDKRGEYFGWRSKVLGFAAIASTFTAGFILHEAKRFDVFLGFAAVFAMAFIFRLVSWRCLNKMHEPEMRRKDGDYFTLYDFISRMRNSNFGRFVLFVSLMKLAVYVASPYFAVLMLKDLKFDYITYTAITVASALSTNLTIKRWGMHADRVGNLMVLKITSRLAAFIPLLWLINQHPAFLFFTQVFAGFAWAGFNLSASNFIYDACSPGKRTRCIAYFNFFSGLSLCAGALIGAFLAERLSAGIFGYGIMNIIFISAVLRLAVAFIIPFRLKEVRAVEGIKGHELIFSVINAKPAFAKERADLTQD
ncbi:MAG: MFS transporter [Deltaproteobacteria bacterium]|nr:MFS transporter [Deltaproteobacteria bacterium]